MKLKNIYFAVSPRADEIEAVRIAQPKNVLVSYALWSKKDLKTDLINKIGYVPENIILDSGAFTFDNADTDIGLLDILEMYAEDYLDNGDIANAANDILYDTYCLDPFFGKGFEDDTPENYLPVFHEFVKFIDNNRKYITHMINMDTIGDATMSRAAFDILNDMGMNPVPVFGFYDDFSVLENYVAGGAEYIALGGSAQRAPYERIEWANKCAAMYPHVKFHLLGTLNEIIINSVRKNIYSVDGTAWNATRKERRYEGRTKVEQSVHNIIKKQALASYEFQVELHTDETGQMRFLV